jgi:hypothetical protein
VYISAEIQIVQKKFGVIRAEPERSDFPAQPEQTFGIHWGF